jgi:hypothetical protein
LLLLPVFGAIGLVNLLPAFHPKPVLVYVNEMVLLITTDCWMFFFNPVFKMVSFDGGVKPVLILIGMW